MEPKRSSPDAESTPGEATDPFNIDDSVLGFEPAPSDGVDTEAPAAWASLAAADLKPTSPAPGSTTASSTSIDQVELTVTRLRASGATSSGRIARPSGLSFGESIAVNAAPARRARRLPVILGGLAAALAFIGWRMLDEPPWRSDRASAPPASASSASPAVEGEPATATAATQAAGAIERLIRRWATAWAERRVDDYFSCYSEDYSPAGTGRDDWMRQRRARIESPRTLAVSVSEIEIVKLDGRDAIVSFYQTYVADSEHRTTWKHFKLVDRDGGWKIRQEGMGRR